MFGLQRSKRPKGPLVNASCQIPVGVQPHFAQARSVLESTIDLLAGGQLAHATHDEVERAVTDKGRELMRLLLGGHFELRGHARPCEAVVGSDGATRAHCRPGTVRRLVTTVGEVLVPRPAYSGRGLSALHPTDADLNLPPDSFSFELRRTVAEFAAEQSFDRSAKQVKAVTGVAVGQRQVEELTRAAAADFHGFYLRCREPVGRSDTGSLLVLTFDQKGVVMRREGLRDATRQRAEAAQPMLDSRLTKGEKRDCKRMATVAAVYTVAPHARTADQVVAGLRHLRVVDAKSRTPPPRPEGKRVWASLQDELATVVAQAFAEAQARDPRHEKRWLVIIDGDRKLQRAVQAQAARLGVAVTIVLDFIHALEYLWRAGHALCAEGSRELEDWVLDRLAMVLNGKASDVAAGMRRSATLRELSAQARKPIDVAANYILSRKDMMRYDQLLALGAPIASGVIEGTCRSLVNDRMDLTGARWSLAGAEAMLQLRAILRSGDWVAYWKHHTEAERVVNHDARYARSVAPKVELPRKGAHLRRIK